MTTDKNELNNDNATTENPTTNNEENEKDDSSTEKAEKQPEEDVPEWQDLLGSGSILKKVIKEGRPNSRPQRLQTCILNYTLSLEDGSVIDKEEDLEIQLGDCEVVQGLDVALGLMNEGENCIIKIQPRLAFGTVGLPPKIDPNTPVVYDVELLSVHDEVDPESLTILQRKVQGNKKREKGNWWYGRGENTLAIQCYRRALDFLDEVEGGITDPAHEPEITDADLQELLEDRISVCNNMAAAQIKLELYEAALNSLGTVLRCQPNNVKALFRKAKIHRAKNDLNAAMSCLKRADDLSPGNGDVEKEISAISKLIQKQKVTERELAKRMFGEAKPAVKPTSGDEKPKKNFLRLSATVAASVAVALAGVAAYKLKYF